MNPCKYIAILFFASFIAACGGGGGGDSADSSASSLANSVSSVASSASSVASSTSSVASSSSVDNQPAAFSLTDQIDVQLETLIESNSVIVSDLSTLVPVSITGGEYSIDGAVFTSEPGFIGDGQSIVVRQMSSSYYSHTSVLNLTIGTFSESFSLTTRMTSFVPDQVINGDDGIIYIFSGENGVVFRWSIHEAKYLDSLVVGVQQGDEILVPIKVAFSAAHNRLYLGYSTGAVRYIDLDGSFVEQPFANVATEVNGLAAVGNFVLAQDYSGAWATHYILNENGEITDSKDWNYYSQEYAWDAVNSRVYFFRDDTSPNDLHYEVIDQSTGEITGEGETPYHGAYFIQPPIRISANGQYILLGSGDIYKSSDMTVHKSLDSNVSDAAWSESLLITIDSAATLNLFNKDTLAAQGSIQITGTPIKIIVDGLDLMLVHEVAGALTFTKIAIGDHDEDGLPKWWEDLYSLSDEDPLDADLDNDSDGLYNFEEFAESTLPNNADSDEDGISDGDEVSLYFTNPVSEDSDADLLNDFDEVFTHLTNPLDSDSDNDGFSDYMEVIQYMTDPNDINSIPPALTTMNESFEEEDIPEFWVSATNSDADWYIDSTQSLAGTQSLRSGMIADGQNSGIKFSTLFAAGTLQFYTKIESEGCCDHLRLYVDGSEHEVPSSSDWESISIELSAGVHEIELRYVKDGSVSFGADAVWIDNVTFSAN